MSKDYWNLSEEYAFLTEAKMRALGVSPAMLDKDLGQSGKTMMGIRVLEKYKEFLEEERWEEQHRWELRVKRIVAT